MPARDSAEDREINCQIAIVWQLIIPSLHGDERLHFSHRRQLRAFNWAAMTWFLFIVHSSMNYLVFDYYHSNACTRDTTLRVSWKQRQGCMCNVLSFIDFLSDAFLCALSIRTHINVIAFVMDCDEFFMGKLYWDIRDDGQFKERTF